MLTALLLSLIAAFWPSPECAAGACDCMMPRTAAKERDAAAAVFEGRVVGIRDTVVVFQEYDTGMRAVTLRIGRAWKGVDAETVTVVTGWGGGDCGFHFETGRTYLVYAYPRRDVIGEPPLATSICSRTAEAAAGAADIRDLGEPVRTWAGAASGGR